MSRATARRLEDRAEEFVHNSPRGERGELGENPHDSSENAGRIRGEKGRILGEIAPFSPPEYPIDALGPLADACRSIAEGGQLDPAMAGQSLLSVAALVCQQCADVETLAGIKPLSLYLLTVGESGDGKSTAEGAALAPVREFQREAARRYRDELDRFDSAMATRKKGDAKPERPREPYVISADGTVEGIRRGYVEGRPSQGVFTSEAATMLSGYGMSIDNRAKTAACFNGMWDSGELSVSRSLAGRIQLYDRRLSLHWLIQPDAATEAMNDPLLSGIGFWPRFLVAWPAPSAPRKARPFEPEKIPAVGAFWARCSAILSDPVGEDCGSLRVLVTSPEAHAFARKFFEIMEESSKIQGGKLETVKPFALRATEQLLRVGGVLACFGGMAEIDLPTIKGAAALVSYSLETWRGIFGARQEVAARSDARVLLDWMKKQAHGRATETAMLRIGPKTMRSRSKRDTALSSLQSAGLVRHAIEFTASGERTLPNTWEVVADA
ncbi:DUF3987 domain-containing protein [Methylococcus sp. ANG]|uniref:DUF3987 domain-containing protein n=1 Tax=Methylococcus sp. ANG TaxID=3231903 RepID=UPI003457F6D8